MAAFVSMENLKTGEFRVVNIGSKIVQVKGVMPLWGSLTLETTHKGRQCQPLQSRWEICGMA